MHRDLKPENLLLVSDESDTDIKLVDFGFARHIKDLSGDVSICGTPDYIAPEILKREGYSSACDIWSAGIIAYVLLGGYPPFYDEDDAKLYRKIMDGDFSFHSPYWDDVSPEAKDLIGDMLRTDPAARPSAATLLKSAWLGSSTDADLTETTLPMLRKMAARRKLKGGVRAVMAVNRMANLGAAFGKSS